jgi:hypothetical protein
MAYFADFPLTRLALDEISKRFPLESGIPDSLKSLFEMLAQLEFEAVGSWSERLSAGHIDLLCNNFHQTQNTRVLLVIALILWEKRDKRIRGLLEAFFHHLPPQEEQQYLATVWPQMAKEETQVPRWIQGYLDIHCKGGLIAYLSDSLKRGSLTQHDLDEHFPETSPLFRELTDTLFKQGGSLCELISGKRANAAAMRYLKQGEDALLIGFLTHYPHERWVPELMLALHKTKGPADPEASAFWQKLERPRLWGIRALTFTELMKKENYSSEKVIFWNDWLHKTQAWYFKPNVVRVLAKPLLIEDSGDVIRVSMAQNPHHWLAEIRVEHSWESKLEAVFNEYLDWTQQY